MLEGTLAPPYFKFGKNKHPVTTSICLPKINIKLL